MYLIHKFGHRLGATLLVAGITIGVGMLALPLSTAAAGFAPSLVIYLITWLFMVCTGLLIAEACSWAPAGANLVTLADHLLGKGGKIFCWVVYLYLFFCLMIAHVAGAGDIVGMIFKGSLPYWGSVLLYIVVFAPAVYLGTLWVDRLNLLLMAGVGLTFFCFLAMGVSHIQLSQLTTSNWSKIFVAMPVIFTAFGFQSLVPTLMTYLKRDLKEVRKVIIIGTGIPLVLYILWQFLILGIVPMGGAHGLIESLQRGENAVTPLQNILRAPSLIHIGNAFAFFALSCSSVGIAIAFVDFLADGLNVKKTAGVKLGLCSIVFLLPAIVAIINPRIFIIALTYAGGIGVALLLGAMPIAMVWVGRYCHRHSLKYQQIPGGKISLIILMAFVIMELLTQFI